MNRPIKLLAFAGSARRDSLNRKLLAAAVESARSQGAEVTVFELRTDTLPLYDGDLETAGLPASVVEAKRLFAAHDGFLIASPEYNMFFTPLFKNTIDWLSRPAPAEVPSPFAGKTAALLSASPGAYGGMRALPFVRLLLSKLGIMITSSDLAVGAGHSAIGDGKLNDPKQQQALDKVVAELIALTRSLKPL
jgi:chromate reductase, NAD(P)H dehydrogenase (quinone)